MIREQEIMRMSEVKEEGNDNKEMTILSAVDQIVTLAKESQLSDEFIEEVEPYITYISIRQNITKMQALMLALVIENAVNSGSLSLSDIAVYLDCRNIQVMMYKNEIEELVKKGLLRKVRCHISGKYEYAITPTLIDTFAKNEPFQRQSYKNATAVQFFQHFYDITHLRHEDELSTELMVEEVQRLIDENPQLPYVKALRRFRMSAISEIVITHMSRHLVLSGNTNIPIDHLVFLFDDKHRRYNFDHEMSTGEHYLVRRGWVENAFSDGFKSKNEYQLTAKARETFLKGFDIKVEENTPCDIVQSGNIINKKLFFNNHVMNQLEGLTELLDENRYQSICNRLKEKGLRQGFACLFYGAPGTGKTESVFQLAKQTGRDIMQVNISKIKSMWVGESEKNVQGIFDRYRAIAKNSERAPILLFNEADAIISKRMEGVERSVDKMENAMQNIILQEMESLDGIMIATTNLVENMDAAFERRFLYKVKFEKPELSQRTQIWQSMMPTLSEKAAIRLASAYDFSGGQIENIARKCDIESILYGNDYVTDEKIDQYCREERIVKKGGTRIGFR